MSRQHVSSFAEIEAAFQQRVRAVVWCSASTVDRRGRPRSRVLHPVWEGATGWVTTRRNTPKIRHLAANPHLALAYVAEPFRPVYVDCLAAWVDDPATQAHIWELCRSLPEPYGFDPALAWDSLDHPENGLLRLAPWRIELNDFSPPPQTIIWETSLPEAASRP